MQNNQSKHCLLCQWMHFENKVWPHRATSGRKPVSSSTIDLFTDWTYCCLKTFPCQSSAWQGDICSWIVVPIMSRHPAAQSHKPVTSGGHLTVRCSMSLTNWTPCQNLHNHNHNSTWCKFIWCEAASNEAPSKVSEWVVQVKYRKLSSSLACNSLCFLSLFRNTLESN